MKKSIFLILPAVMLMLASCMDSASGNGGAGSVRVVLPGSSRNVSSSDRADSYTVSLLKGGKVIESQTAVPGGGPWSSMSLMPEATRLTLRRL